jgi:hypothetical protein
MSGMEREIIAKNLLYYGKNKKEKEWFWSFFFI